jgi:2-succinyl-5-enolpyruvyl-6-hydroxy-3-cyclohexene-1-carboxylate synthase
MGNRGTSGIDGSLSTAVGFASASDKLNTIILGDLSFFYDSNALWNKYIGQNLRIIVIHNGGGNIFSMIKGPGESPAFNEFFFTENRTSAAGIAQTFGLDYFKAENEMELESTA